MVIDACTATADAALSSPCFSSAWWRLWCCGWARFLWWWLVRWRWGLLCGILPSRYTSALLKVSTRESAATEVTRVQTGSERLIQLLVLPTARLRIITFVCIALLIRRFAGHCTCGGARFLCGTVPPLPGDFRTPRTQIEQRYRIHEGVAASVCDSARIHWRLQQGHRL